MIFEHRGRVEVTGVRDQDPNRRASRWRRAWHERTRDTIHIASLCDALGVARPCGRGKQLGKTQEQVDQA